MKIAQISATFPPYMAGTGNVCYHNAVELAKLGHDVTVFTSRYPDEDYTYPDSITVKRYKPWFRIGNAPFLPQLLSLRGFDIIHLHYPFFFGGEMIYLLSKLTKQKYVITYHNDVILQGLARRFLTIYNSLVTRLVCGRSQKICVTSIDYGKHSEVSKTIQNVTEKLREIPNGVDINRFSFGLDQGEIRKRYGIESKKIVLFVGALDSAHYFKGVDYLLRSFAQIHDEDVCLIVVGDGDLRQSYIELSQSLNISDRTFFTGRVPDDDLPKYYAATDLAVLPSVTMGEAFGLVLVEAMACGKPVIASDLPGVRTVVDDGVNGFLVRPRDCEDLATKMRLLLENNEIRVTFGRAGRKKVEEKYSWENIGKKLERLYLEEVV
jgi:glycosyltransferase involved in cell wall biosynthesis